MFSEINYIFSLKNLIVASGGNHFTV